MNLIQSIILGIIQGLTEFLPVSSSAHLVIAQNLLGIREPQIFFDIMLHLGTLCAVVVYFYKDILGIIKSLLDARSDGFKLGILLIIATIPTGIGGFLLKDYFENMFSSPLYSSFFLVITGTILFFTRFKKDANKTIRDFSIVDSVLIGIAQLIAIAPGISRSGMTISAGIFRGLDRKLCAKFSLLLSIPAIMGAVVAETGEFRLCGIRDLLNIFIGFLTSFLVGYVAIILLVKVLEKAKFYMFSYYCWIIGSLSVLYFLMHKGG